MNALSDNNSSQILASSQGYNYTEAHYQKELRFLEFVIGAKINSSELAEGKKESINAFIQDSVYILQEVQNVDTEMQRVYQLTDPYQIAIARSAFLSIFHTMAQQTNEELFMFKMLEKYAPALAIDPQNMLTFTE